MRPVLGSGLIAACMAFSAAAYAQSGADVVKSKGCSTCHAVDKKLVGPAYKAIAAKHKGDVKAEAQLTDKVKNAKGHPKVQASDAELKAAVQYILKQ